jgi:hypothetical protein
MDPVTERTVSSIDLLIFSDISDSSLTLSNGGAHSHSPYTSNSHERKKILCRDQESEKRLPLEALADTSTLHS